MQAVYKAVNFSIMASLAFVSENVKHVNENSKREDVHAHTIHCI
jgi:hypothetical protein